MSDFIKLNILDGDIDEAINYARDHIFMDNLRNRSPFVQFDTKMRGKIGEIGIGRLLDLSGISVIKSDVMDDGTNIDIDLLVGYGTFHNKIEIKTSLVPDKWKTIDKVMENADIKIIRREDDYHSISMDVCVQIYFNFYRNKRDNYLKQLRGDISEMSNDEIKEKLDVSGLKQIFVAWIDKVSLINFLDSQRIKVWRFGMREFWRCPLKISRKPSELVWFLKGELNSNEEN